jgi:hypothetical protein
VTNVKGDDALGRLSSEEGVVLPGFLLVSLRRANCYSAAGVELETNSSWSDRLRCRHATSPIPTTQTINSGIALGSGIGTEHGTAVGQGLGVGVAFANPKARTRRDAANFSMITG